MIQRAHILLWSDAGKQDKEIIGLLDCAPLTVASTRERWVREKRLEDLPRLGSKPMLDAKQESLLIALACSDAPGRTGRMDDAAAGGQAGRVEGGRGHQ